MTRSSPKGCMRRVLAGALALTSLSVLGAGCLDRPVAPATPTTSARVAERAKQNTVDKIDLLFMIDNSSSMADKQAILADAVPDLVSRLVSPVCVDPKNDYAWVSDAPVPPAGCPAGSEQDFKPVGSIHVGIVTSSLGGHGTTNCPETGDTRPDAHNNDNGHLITRGDTANATPLGFLDYESGKPVPNDAPTVKSSFSNMVKGVGQHGCGYEASLEAAYRFLIDPDPPSVVNLVASGGTQVLQAVYPDTTTLQERADFLRPDSLVAVIMVTDEDDCSIMDEGQAYLAIRPAEGTGTDRATLLSRGTSVCDSDPNNPCCFNCGVLTPPAGCAAPGGDPNCQPGTVNYKATEDPDNLRCFHMKQRHGIDFLYPVSRYITGYTSPKIRNRQNAEVQNPLFDDLKCPATAVPGSCARTPERDPSLVFFAGIVGVPWQDIAKDPADLSKGYKDYKALTESNVWQVILGDPTASPLLLPSDPLMIESVAPRTATTTTNPLQAAALPQPATAAVGANVVNGHEWDTTQAIPPNSDLQYACIFDLPASRDCTDPANAKDCDCVSSTTGGTVATMMNPLCQGAGGYTQTQLRAKGYPGIRHLQVLQGLGEQGIVASICPAKIQVAQKNDKDYGYRPAIAALIDRLRAVLRGRCMPRQLDIDPTTGNVPCIVLEAFTPDTAAGQTCDCDTRPGRGVPEPSAIPDDMKAYPCICMINQVQSADARAACQTNPDVYQSTESGWCYVDPNSDQFKTDPTGLTGACSIVKNCPATDKRLIRFVGTDDNPGEPRSGSMSLILCQEAAFPTAGGAAAVNPCP